MKKIGSILLAALLLLFALVSCGGPAESQKLKVIDIPLTEEEYAFAVKKGDAELLASVNAFLATIQENGEFEKVLDRYFKGGTPVGVASAAEDASKDQIVIATNAAFAPFEYKTGDTYYGVDMEIMKMYADSVGKELVINNMEFASVCTSVAEGMCDIAASGLTVTDVRKETLDFTTSYYNASQMIITKESDTQFDACKTADDVIAVLNALPASTKVGVQDGTTGMFFVKGDEDWGFDGFKVECVPYEAGALAAQNILNGNVAFVVIDEMPAKSIVASLND
ncbi:MAG: transporter substrate-binding domain-containing protein [Clostridia bacterium]|nr:transporter substrate-binding domain-containing protein [Clostridia bacterium]MBO4798926.1 transporter substrate-binding domain-containing protein [Candidatus Methanomethylophilaceae archaeon]